MSRDIYCVRSALQCPSRFFETKRTFWKILRKICSNQQFQSTNFWFINFPESSLRRKISDILEKTGYRTPCWNQNAKSESSVQLKVFTWYKINMMTFQLHISIETPQVVIFSKIEMCMNPLKPFPPKPFQWWPDKFIFDISHFYSCSAHRISILLLKNLKIRTKNQKLLFFRNPRPNDFLENNDDFLPYYHFEIFHQEFHF